MRNLAPFASLLAIAAALPGQTTHLVGPGGLPQIRDALAIAAPGDVLHVLPGTYAHFEANVGVTIRALVPGSVTVEYDPSFLPPGCVGTPFCEIDSSATRFAPPSGQAVHVTGLVFAPNTSGLARHRVHVSSGTVTFDECTIDSLDWPALTIQGAQVHLQECSVVAHGDAGLFGLNALDSNLIAADSSIGTTGLFGFNDGLRLRNSTLRATGCLIFGNHAIAYGGSAVSTDSASRLWISDSALDVASGICPIDGTPAVCQIARTTLPPLGVNCTVPTEAPLVGIERVAPIQNGSTFSVNVRTEPLHLVAIHASPNLAHTEVPGLFAQPLGLDLGAFFLAGVFVSDSNGDLTASWNMPVGQYVDETIWLETIVLPVSGAILVGPPVGGVIR